MQKRGRGRPKVKRKPGEKILHNNLLRDQWSWIVSNWKRANFTSAADYHRYIVQQHIEMARSGVPIRRQQ